MQRYILNANGPERAQVLANAHAFIDRLPARKSWKIEVSEYRKVRSLSQNAALWACAYPPLMEFMGEEGEEAKKRLHFHFCGEFFGWVNPKIGERRPIRTTTKDEDGQDSTIDTLTMSRFYDFVQRQGAELGVDIPEPDPMYGVRARWAA